MRRFAIEDEFAGEVVKGGLNFAAEVKASDKVASAVLRGVFRERGAFSEYTKTSANLAFVISKGSWSVDRTCVDCQFGCDLPQRCMH